MHAHAGEEWREAESHLLDVSVLFGTGLKELDLILVCERLADGIRHRPLRLGDIGLVANQDLQTHAGSHMRTTAISHTCVPPPHMQATAIRAVN